MTPITLMLPTIAAILIGGAELKKATVSNVIIGMFLLQGIVTVGLMVAGISLNDMAEALRLLIVNGVILYALMKKQQTGFFKYLPFRQELPEPRYIHP